MAFIGTFRNQLKAALGASVTNGAYSLTAANIVVGYDDRGPSSEMIKDIGTSAPLMYIRPATLTGIDRQVRSARFWTVVVDLYFGFARETDNAMTDIEGLLEAIFDKWDVAANFSGVGIPEQITAAFSADTKQSPVFAHYEIEVSVTAAG